MKTLLLVPILLLPAGAFAQDNPSTPSPRRVVLPTQTQPSRPALRPAAQRPTAATTTKPAELSENVVLNWVGSYQGMVDIDVHLTGCGPEFRTEFTLPSGEKTDLPPTIFSIQAIVLPAGDRYRVEFTMGARIPVQTGRKAQGQNAIAAHIEFREVLNSGTVIVAPGKPVVLSKLGERTLTFTLAAAE